jgi:hypothetical protein
MTGEPHATRYLIRGGRIYDHEGDIHQPATVDLLIRGGLAGKIGFTARSSCQPGGVPGFALFGVRPVYFLQTPKEVVIIYSGDRGEALLVS